MPGSLGSKTISRSKLRPNVFGIISSSLTDGKLTYRVSPGLAVGGVKVSLYLVVSPLNFTLVFRVL